MPEQCFDIALKGAEHIIEVRLREVRNDVQKSKFLVRLLGIRLHAARNEAPGVQQLYPSLSGKYNTRLENAQKRYEELIGVAQL